MTRVFSAIDIEDPEVLEELARVRDKLDLNFNPVGKEKMHITLEFFQDASKNEIEKIKKGIESVESSQFKIEIRSVGAFPSEDYIRVVWAGAPNEAVYELQKQVSRHPVNEDSDHDFKPHVTLMRVEDVHGDRKKKLQRTMREFKGHSFGTIEVNSVKLFESVLNSKETVYKELFEKEL